MQKFADDKKMGKGKKNKVKSEKILQRRSKTVEKQLNPFEVHINKEKHAVLNRKLKNSRMVIS